MTMQSVVISLDGSPFAEAALPLAVRLAREARARLTLLRVHELATDFGPIEGAPMVGVPDQDQIRSEELAYLAGKARSLGTVGGHEVAYRLIDGVVGDALVNELDRVRPDVFVISTHGRGALGRAWLGSVADHVIRHTAVPVLLVRPKDGKPVLPEDFRFDRCLVPLDQSAASEAILAPLVPFALVTQAHLTLLHVNEPSLGIAGSMPPIPIVFSDEEMTARQEASARYLEQVAERLRSKGMRVATKGVIGVSAVPSILDELATDAYDFVAMTTQGATGLRRLLLGSVAGEIIRGAGVPVLVVRPDESAS
ncbi:MAG: universal stress protein [Gemmatimonadales bacterium]